MINAPPNCTVLISVDGTDCPIKEPQPFDRKWYSHKFHGPGVRYEVGVAIYSGVIVWVHGPFPCGEWSDIRIVRDALIGQLCEDESYIANGGYSGAEYSITPSGRHTFRDRQISVVRSRHEVVNQRLKEFQCLGVRSRHPPERHGFLFRAVANIVNLKLKTSMTLNWQVQF